MNKIDTIQNEIADIKKLLKNEEFYENPKEALADRVEQYEAKTREVKSEIPKTIKAIAGTTLIRALLENILVKDKSLNFSAKGISIKSSVSGYRVYDKKEKQVVRLSDDMIIENIDIFVQVPTNKKLLSEGDLIIQDGIYYFVKQVDNTAVLCVNIEEAKIESLVPIVDTFGNAVYTKVYSAVDMFGGYAVLKKMNAGVLTIITALWKNKDNLEGYLQREGSYLVTPFIVNQSQKPKSKFLKKNGVKIMVALATVGIVSANVDKEQITSLLNKKIDKKKAMLTVSLVGLALSTYVITNKKLRAKIKKAVIITKVKDKASETTTTVRNWFKKTFSKKEMEIKDVTPGKDLTK